jgi:sulfur-oxidizing protein SoxY
LKRIIAIGVIIISHWAMGVAAAESSIDIWTTLLKPKYFPDAILIEGSGVIELTSPYRAEDAAVTPVSVRASFPQSTGRFVKTIYMFVEGNPQPLAGIFHLTKEMGRADLAMRVRVDKYTNVRAIAVLNNGEHHMVTNFVKASGGCSAPLSADYSTAMQSIGGMKFKIIGDRNADETAVAQFMLSHPNVTGMQKDQKTQLIRPAHYVESVEIFFNDTHVMTAQTGFSISADPSFRFFFKPVKGGKIRAIASDSKGNSWTQTFDVEAGRSL